MSFPRRLILAPLAMALASSVLATAGDMSVATFLSKVDALKARGVGALFSSDIKVLRSEGQAAGMAYHSELSAERNAGHPSSCPPPKVQVNSDSLIAYFRSLPAAERPRMPLKAGIRSYFVHTWPCR